MKDSTVPAPPGASEPRLRHAPATVHGRYLVRPHSHGAGGRWLVGFHGYAQSAEVFFEPLRALAPAGAWTIVSVQALHPFYAARSQQVVANWMTREDRELAIADNVAYVDAVLDQLEREFGAPRSLVFAGFSQGVAMAFRAALAGAHPAAGLVAVGGDVPPELRGDTRLPWPRVLLATGARDEWYSPARLAADFELVSARRRDSRTLVFDGGHEWHAELVAAAAAFLAEIAEER